MEEQTTTILDLDEVLFSQEQLAFYYRQMEKMECLPVFVDVWNRKDREGLVVSDAYGDDYKTRRRYYDKCIAVLEFSGFIVNRPIGRENHFFPTIRGIQMARYLRDRRGN